MKYISVDSTSQSLTEEHPQIPFQTDPSAPNSFPELIYYLDLEQQLLFPLSEIYEHLLLLRGQVYKEMQAHQPELVLDKHTAKKANEWRRWKANNRTGFDFDDECAGISVGTFRKSSISTQNVFPWLYFHALPSLVHVPA